MCVTKRTRAHVSFVSSEGDDAIEKCRIYGALNLAHNMVTWNKVSCSLPLMGIENANNSPHTASCSKDSLPLMGIENLPRRRADVVALIELITPHGDRKPCVNGALDGFPQLLITPHGDRKLQSRLIETAQLCAHYPSWGSKTRRLRALGGNQYRKLITPHGDRKPDRRADPPRRRDALITPHGDRKQVVYAAAPVARRDVSLPLMGIENGSMKRTAGAIVVSLPLMGIENSYKSTWPT